MLKLMVWIMLLQENVLIVLDDNMSLLDEYARNKEDKLISNQLKEGLKPEFIARTNHVPLDRVKRIEMALGSER